mgnify:CR=1 FL=1
MKKIYLAFLLVLFLATVALAKVNINTATADELAALNGIGKVKAEAIVAYRTANGKFKAIEDLKKVTGIGDKTIEKLKGDLSVDK